MLTPLPPPASPVSTSPVAAAASISETSPVELRRMDMPVAQSPTAAGLIEMYMDDAVDATRSAHPWSKTMCGLAPPGLNPDMMPPEHPNKSTLSYHSRQSHFANERSPSSVAASSPAHNGDTVSSCNTTTGSFILGSSSPERDGGKSLNSTQFLGRGASGSVHVEFHDKLLQNVARKTVRAMDEDRCKNAVAELEFARRAINLHSTRPDLDIFANIVEVFEAYHDDGQHEVVITMGHMPNGTVATLPPFRSAGGIDPEDEFSLGGGTATAADGAGGEDALVIETSLARIARDVLRGLRMLHEELRVLHRDLKPENILIAADGTAKIADFGVAALLPPDRDTAEDQVGSVLYMSPERLRGNSHGPKSDVWSLGVTLLQLALRGKHPFVDTMTLGGSVDRFWCLAERFALSSSREDSMAAVQDTVETALARVEMYRGAHFSAEFHGFIRAVLAADESLRCNVGEALALPWILNIPST